MLAPGGGGEFVVLVKRFPDVDSLIFGPTNDVTTGRGKRRLYLRREIRGACKKQKGIPAEQSEEVPRKKYETEHYFLRERYFFNASPGG